MILAKINEVNVNKYPVIFMGDLNSEPNTDRIASLKKIMKDTRDVSEQSPFGPSGSFNGFKYNEPATLLIDYVFVDNSGRFKVRKYGILTDSINLRFPSDHFPVLVEMLLSK